MNKTNKLSPIYVDPNSRTHPKVTTIMRKPRKLSPFPWYGGKYIHLGWLLPLLPKCHHYCEPFGGSAAVLLSREPSPIETYNDIDGDIPHFFKTLRNHKERLIEAISLTPFSREEFFLSVVERDYPDPTIDDIERARLFFIRAKWAFAGRGQTASLGRWGYSKNSSRRHMSSSVSKYLASVELLPEIADRLLTVQIENRPAIDVIELYDSPNTLFYCDPPYIHGSRSDTRSYSFEMTNDDHVQLANILSSCKARVAVSGYRCDLMDELYKGWTRHDAPQKAAPTAQKPRQESLWTNY